MTSSITSRALFAILVVFLVSQPVLHAEDGDDAVMALTREYIAKRKLPTRSEGDGLFRILWVGNAAAPAKTAMVKHGNDAIKLLELWTGKNHLFAPEKPTPADTFWLVIMPTDADVIGLLDLLRSQKLLGKPENGDDLARKLANVVHLRVRAFSFARINPAGNFDHMAAYTAACMAFDCMSYFAKLRGHHWMREGFATEVQMALLGSVRATTVAYELTDKSKGTGDWYAEMTAIFNGTVKGVRLMYASDALAGTLDAIPTSMYQQYCAMFIFLRDSALMRKDAVGPDN
ncbi:MAG: hypothetical protein AAB263_07795, partial [Planctomycetota bacterium]